MIIGLIVGILVVAIIGVGVLAGGAPFVPTRKIWIDDAMKLAKVSADDVIVDLGSGDGAVLKQALKKGAKRAIGYEVNPLLVWWSRLRLKKFGKRAVVLNQNFFHEKLPRDTTVIYLFQVDKVLKKIPRFIEKQRANLTTKKLRVVCFGFALPDLEPKQKRGGMNLYEF
ncbi:hypothetical protein FWG95_02105 [Candidatus Saccharibacteria bacterium]|nr:hypothetical protein [Candidatus Saccharibacteria bacterium]